jgi:hypothetical protein
VKGVRVLFVSVSSPMRLGDCPSFYRPKQGQFTGVPHYSLTCEGMVGSAAELTAVLANLAPVGVSWRVLYPYRSDFKGSGIEVGCPTTARRQVRGWCQRETVRGTVAGMATSCPCALQQRRGRRRSARRGAAVAGMVAQG